MVAAGLGLEAALSRRAWRAVRRHPVAERRGIPHEAALVLLLAVAAVVPLAVDEKAHRPMLS